VKFRIKETKKRSFNLDEFEKKKSERKHFKKKSKKYEKVCIIVFMLLSNFFNKKNPKLA
jgi:uncharacterized membrane protein